MKLTLNPDAIIVIFCAALIFCGLLVSIGHSTSHVNFEAECREKGVVQWNDRWYNCSPVQPERS